MERFTILSAVADCAFQRGLEGAVGMQRDLLLIEETSDARHTLRMVAQSHPDVLLLDEALARSRAGGGASLLDSVHAASPRTRTILFSENAPRTVSAGAISAGLRGHMQTHCSPEECLRAIHAVISGDAWMSRAELIAAIEQTTCGALRRSARPRILEPLTSRELDVLKGIREGLSNKEIASRLRVGDATVKTHVSHIFQKLGVTRRTHLVFQAPPVDAERRAGQSLRFAELS